MARQAMRRDREVFASYRRATLERIYRLVGEAPPWEASDRPPDAAICEAVEIVSRDFTVLRLRALVELLLAARARAREVTCVQGDGGL